MSTTGRTDREGNATGIAPARDVAAGWSTGLGQAGSGTRRVRVSDAAALEAVSWVRERERRHTETKRRAGRSSCASGDSSTGSTSDSLLLRVGSTGRRHGTSMG
ncbi:MAG: hypothetical protein INR71_06140 [Terriglobus roseus]|nr:hypothetical protein [Terriglobus roseus]